MFVPRSNVWADRIDHGELRRAHALRPALRGEAGRPGPLLVSERSRHARELASAGRRSGSSVSLPPECISETVPAKPTWRSHARRSWTAAAGCATGAEPVRSRARLCLDAYTTDGGSKPGLTISTSVLESTVSDGGAETVLLFFVTQVQYPIQNGAISVLARHSPSSPVRATQGFWAKHVRVR